MPTNSSGEETEDRLTYLRAMTLSNTGDILLASRSAGLFSVSPDSGVMKRFGNCSSGRRDNSNERLPLLKTPTAVAFANNQLYVLDYSTANLHIYE